MTECVVYWKHLKDMSNDYSDGYIGISKHFEERQKQHHRDAFVRNSIYTVHERMRMHGDEVQTSIIFEGSINDCFDYEEELRPRWRIGWNMAIGGGRPGSGWKPSPLWLDNRLWHSQYGEILINKPLIEITKQYCEKPIQATSMISKLLLGKMPKYENLELADAQLVEKIKERFYMKWQHAYLRKVDNPNHVVSIYKSGNSAFHESIGLTSQFGVPRTLQILGQSKKAGWELASEEEWLSTKERIEFK